MKYFGPFSFLIVLLIAAISVLTGSGCANMFPPTGGPKDTLPPVLVDASPENVSLNFSANKIILEFDEYIDLHDAHQNLLVTPVPKGMPTVESKLKTITIHLKDTLQPNTTYTINFGNAIRDINEGNVLKNFIYVFSTGPYIDSMEFSGKVLLAATGKVDSTLIVMLHKHINDDSAVAKQRPMYITRVGNDGSFRFRYIKPGTYRIFALQDESGQHEYTSKGQLFAFLDSPITVLPNSPPVTLFAFSDTTGMKTTKRSQPAGPAVKKPTTKEKEKEKRLVVHVNITQGQVDLLSPLEFQFETPLKYFDTAKVQFTDDQYKPLHGYHWQLDTGMKKVDLHYTWTPDTRYHLIAAKDFAQDTLGNQLLKADTITFRTMKETDYGSLQLRFKNLDLSKNPVLLFVQNDKIVKKYAFSNSTTFFEKLFHPGEYELRILYDTNKNLVWDTGDFYKHIQPEIVQQIKGKINVRSNWDNQIDIVL